MTNKNIYLTTEKQTIIPIYYIDSYEGENKEIIQKYKFNNQRYDDYLLKILVDMCIDIIIENKDSDIIFTYPPSTMFYRKEKSIDSVKNLLKLTEIYINDYFRFDHGHKIIFKSLFIPSVKYLKNKKAQHIDGNRKSRTKDLDQRYKISFWNKRYIKNDTKIILIDDVSSTGGTLLACKQTLDKYIQNKNLNNVEIDLYSLMH